VAKVLALSGFMGSGKSSLGRKVATRLGLRFVDLDEEVALKEERTVEEIFADRGETGFRESEEAALTTILDEIGKERAVVSLGGGTVTWPGSAALLRASAYVILISVSPQTAWERVRLETGRPLAHTRDDFFRLAAERSEIYAATADAVVHAEGLEEAEVVESIVAAYREAVQSDPDPAVGRADNGDVEASDRPGDGGRS
jgi:shikimate kinase